MNAPISVDIAVRGFLLQAIWFRTNESTHWKSRTFAPFARKRFVSPMNWPNTSVHTPRKRVTRAKFATRDSTDHQLWSFTWERTQVNGHISASIVIEVRILNAKRWEGENAWCSSCIGFSQSSCLKVHVKRHERGDDKDFQCDQCPRRFISNSSFKEHLASHCGPEDDDKQMDLGL